MSWETMQEIGLRLERIRQSNGFRTDAGANVALGWRFQDAGSALPALTVMEGEYAQDRADGRRPLRGKYRIQWEIEALARADDQALRTLYDVEADVLDALFQPDDNLNGTCFLIEYESRRFHKHEAGAQAVALSVYLSTHHTTT